MTTPDSTRLTAEERGRVDDIRRDWEGEATSALEGAKARRLVGRSAAAALHESDAAIASANAAALRHALEEIDTLTRERDEATTRVQRCHSLIEDAFAAIDPDEDPDLSAALIAELHDCDEGAGPCSGMTALRAEMALMTRERDEARAKLATLRMDSDRAKFSTLTARLEMTSVDLIKAERDQARAELAALKGQATT